MNHTGHIGNFAFGLLCGSALSILLWMSFIGWIQIVLLCCRQ